VVEPVSMTLGLIAAGLVARAAQKAAETAAEKVGERAGDAGAGALVRFAGWLRERVTGHQEAEVAVAGVEEVPDSPSRVRALGAALDHYAVEDAGFGGQLREQVQLVRAQGVDVKTIMQAALGNQNVQLADVEGSHVNVSYGSGQAPPPPPGR
jgi:hypothetical protein